MAKKGWNLMSKEERAGLSDIEIAKAKLLDANAHRARARRAIARAEKKQAEQKRNDEARRESIRGAHMAEVEKRWEETPESTPDSLQTLDSYRSDRERFLESDQDRKLFELPPHEEEHSSEEIGIPAPEWPRISRGLPPRYLGLGDELPMMFERSPHEEQHSSEETELPAPEWPRISRGLPPR
jgi:hypothetical protein